MKTYHLQIDGHPYEVTVAALETNPVLVTVNGETMEVWLEEGRIENARVSPPLRQPQRNQPFHATRPAQTRSGSTLPGAAAAAIPMNGGSHRVLAPIPGVITDLHVKSGQTVNPGDSLCSLEAMKMKNVIRASRQGEIAAIHVTQGQHVRHQQLLMEYAHQDG